MRFGFHVSIAGGFARVCARAEAVHCETMQLFTSSPRGWSVSRLDPDDVARFRRDVEESGITPVFVHAPYLPNLATGDRVLARRSVTALVREAKRCRDLGVRYLVVYVGRAGDAKTEVALRRVVRSVNRVLSRAPESVMLLLENTAGMGSEVGSSFEQIATVLGRVEQGDRVGVVLDTAHLFEAGYDLRTRAGQEQTLRGFDRVVGFGRLHLLHLNDSRTDYGSRVDRHWHIGKGRIGLAGFREIVNHPLLRHLPGVMETPRTTPRDDLMNLRTIRRLVN